MLENLLGTLKSELGSQILNQTQLPANKLGLSQDIAKGILGKLLKK